MSYPAGAQRSYSGQIAPSFAAGLTGATAGGRFTGGTTSGAPSSGSFALGDFAVDQTGAVWVCTAAGSAGTWTSVGGGLSAFLCAPTMYAPPSRGVLTVTGTTFAAFSSSYVNTGSFTAPPSGSVLVTASFIAEIGTGSSLFNIGLAAHGTVTPLIGNVFTWGDTALGQPRLYAAQFLVPGLTPGTS